MTEKSARPTSTVVNLIVTVLAVALPCGTIAWATDLFRLFGLLLYTEQYLAGMLAIALPLVYLHVPAGEGRERKGPVPWYDAVAALLGVAAALYTAVHFPVLSEMIPERPLDGMVTAVIMVVLLVEGLRRTVGKVLTILVIGFIILTLVGHLVPGVLAGRPVDLGRLILYLGWDLTAILGIPMRIVTTIVVAFVLFGQVLFKSGGSDFFTDFAKVLMGRYRGGPAKISVFASGLFGSISGSVVSNVVTTGVISIPMMRKGGYSKHLAGAIEAVASTGGPLMPPVMGATAFLMAEFLAIPYTEVVLAALIPAILYYAALFIQADLEAARGGFSRVPEDEIPAALAVLKAGWFFPLPFAVLIWALFWLNETPELSALYAAAVIALACMLLGYKGKRLTLRDLFDSLRSTGLGVLDIFMIGAAAGIVIGTLNISGLGFGLTLALVQLAGGNLILLLVMAAVVCIILGMGMPTVGVYVLLATLVAPALEEVGIDPIAAHLFILYFGMMSMITPPVAIGAFAAATISGADPMRTGFTAMRFGWLAFIIPFMYVGSTTLLMRGDPILIVIDLATALIGAWLVSVAMIGFFVRLLGPIWRLAFAIAGLALLVPVNAVAGAFSMNLFGLALGVIFVGRELTLRRRLAAA